MEVVEVAAVRQKNAKCGMRIEAFTAADMNGGTGVPGVADSEAGAWLTTGADIGARPESTCTRVPKYPKANMPSIAKS